VIPLARLARRRPRVTIVVAALALVGVFAIVLRPSAGVDRSLSADVRRGTLVVRLNETGILRAAQSVTYRSPLGGRETELVFLAPEGTRVNEGDLVARVDTTGLDMDIQRARQGVRQAEVEVQVAEVDRQEAVAAVESLTEGVKALEVDEARTRLALAEKKVARLRREYESLKPLLEKGFITQEELDRSALELEQTEAEIDIMRRKAGLLVERTRPREEQRARLQLAQREAQLRQIQQKLEEATQQLRALETAKDVSSMHARRPGLVVYEEYLAANPRRKVRVGDRVTASHGLVTIPEVTRMLVESSVREADLHRLRAGQRAAVRVDAYPDLRLWGTVATVGTLARSSVDRPFEDKRFDFVVDLDATDADLRPEMTVRLEIVTGERRGVLLVPVNAVFERDGLSVVHVIGRWQTETRQIDLGQASEFDVEVSAGLREGERVSLTDSGQAPSRAPVVRVPAADSGTRKGEVSR
jgi:HlyD family secretion protein